MTERWHPGENPWRHVNGWRPSLSVVAARLRVNQGQLELRDPATLLEAELAAAAARRRIPRPGILSTDSCRSAAEGSARPEGERTFGSRGTNVAPFPSGV